MPSDKHPNTSLGDVAATIELNGCHSVVRAGTATSGEVVDGSGELVCPEGKQVEVLFGGVCKVDIPPQQISGGASVSNIANGDITISGGIEEEVEYTETDLSFFCPNASNHTTVDGSAFGVGIVRGFEDLGNSEDPSTPGTLLYEHGQARNIAVEVR